MRKNYAALFVLLGVVHLLAVIVGMYYYVTRTKYTTTTQPPPGAYPTVRVGNFPKSTHSSSTQWTSATLTLEKTGSHTSCFAVTKNINRNFLDGTDVVEFNDRLEQVGSYKDMFAATQYVHAVATFGASVLVASQTATHQIVFTAFENNNHTPWLCQDNVLPADQTAALSWRCSNAIGKPAAMCMANATTAFVAVNLENRDHTFQLGQIWVATKNPITGSWSPWNRTFTTLPTQDLWSYVYALDVVGSTRLMASVSVDADAMQHGRGQLIIHTSTGTIAQKIFEPSAFTTIARSISPSGLFLVFGNIAWGKTSVITAEYRVDLYTFNATSQLYEKSSSYSSHPTLDFVGCGVNINDMGGVVMLSKTKILVARNADLTTTTIVGDIAGPLIITLDTFLTGAFSQSVPTCVAGECTIIFPLAGVNVHPTTVYQQAMTIVTN
jgi:hypothetical protein